MSVAPRQKRTFIAREVGLDGPEVAVSMIDESKSGQNYAETKKTKIEKTEQEDRGLLDMWE